MKIASSVRRRITTPAVFQRAPGGLQRRDSQPQDVTAGAGVRRSPVLGTRIRSEAEQGEHAVGGREPHDWLIGCSLRVVECLNEPEQLAEVVRPPRRVWYQCTDERVRAHVDHRLLGMGRLWCAVARILGDREVRPLEQEPAGSAWIREAEAGLWAHPDFDPTTSEVLNGCVEVLDLEGARMHTRTEALQEARGRMAGDDRLGHLDRTVADPGHAAPAPDCCCLAVLEYPEPDDVPQFVHGAVIAVDHARRVKGPYYPMGMGHWWRFTWAYPVPKDSILSRSRSVQMDRSFATIGRIIQGGSRHGCIVS